MALIDQLKVQRETVEAELAGYHADVRQLGETIENLERQRWDLDTAIAALSPPPADPEPDAVLADAPPEPEEEEFLPTQAAGGAGVTDIEPGADPVMLAYPQGGPLPLPDPEPAFAEPQDRYRFSPFGMFRREDA